MHCPQVEADFAAHDAVSLLDTHGVEFGRGLVNYSSDEMARVKVSGFVRRTVLVNYRQDVTHQNEWICKKQCVLPKQADQE